MGHGDAMHVSDWVSWNDGLEVMAVHEHDDAKYHVEIHDAETGEVLMGYYTGKDTGRGVAADIDPTAEGAGSGQLQALHMKAMMNLRGILQMVKYIPPGQHWTTLLS